MFETAAGFKIAVRGDAISGGQGAVELRAVPGPWLGSLRSDLIRVDRVITAHCADFFREIGRRESYPQVRARVAFHWLAAYPNPNVVAIYHGVVDGLARIAFRESEFRTTRLAALIVHELAHAAGVGGEWVVDDPRLSHARAYQAPVRCGLESPRFVRNYNVAGNVANEYSFWLGRSVSPEEARRHLVAEMQWRPDCGRCDVPLQYEGSVHNEQDARRALERWRKRTP